MMMTFIFRKPVIIREPVKCQGGHPTGKGSDNEKWVLVGNEINGEGFEVVEEIPSAVQCWRGAFGSSTEA